MHSIQLRPSLRTQLIVAALAVAASTLGFSGKRKAVEASPPSEEKKLASTQSLLGIQKANLLGIDLESDAYRDWIKDRAKLFVELKEQTASQNDREVFEKECRNEAVRNPFCVFAEDNDEKARHSSASHRNAESRRRAQRVRVWMSSGDLQKLKGADPADIREALRFFRDFGPLTKLAQHITASKDCVPSALSFSLGAKAEERLPDAKFRERAIELYESATRCGDDDSSQRAMYRLSLLRIWSDDCAAALPHLTKLTSGPVNGDFRSRALYWQGHCAEKTGNAELATKARETLVNEHPFSLHAVLVQKDAVTRLKTALQADSPVQLRSTANPAVNEPISAIEALISIKETNRARRLLDSIVPEVEKAEPEFRLYVASLYNRVENFLGKFRILSPLFRDNPSIVSRAALELYYPRKVVNSDVIQRVGLDELLVLSLIRQESAFNERARSRVGARGLMQVMPATARRIERIPASKLYDPDNNIRIGSKYFAQLIRRYDGDTELALAAYNAGALRVDQWQKRYPVEQRTLFVDLIPFKETREYVASIARNYFWYNLLYGEEIQRKDGLFRVLNTF